MITLNNNICNPISQMNIKSDRLELFSMASPIIIHLLRPSGKSMLFLKEWDEFGGGLQTEGSYYREWPCLAFYKDL